MKKNPENVYMDTSISDASITWSLDKKELGLYYEEWGAIPSRTKNLVQLLKVAQLKGEG